VLCNLKPQDEPCATCLLSPAIDRTCPTMNAADGHISIAIPVFSPVNAADHGIPRNDIILLRFN
jgi:hypothetical protein